MNPHDRFAARLREMSPTRPYAYLCDEYTAHDVADDIERGSFDDVLGVREPTIEDVRREAKRCVRDATIQTSGVSGRVDVYARLTLIMRAMPLRAAYAALRALPDYEGE